MKWLRNILKGASLTTALFIFQACYGTPQWLHDSEVQFQVVTQDGSPVDDVEIYTRFADNDDLDWSLCGNTDAEGNLSTVIYFDENNDPQVRVSDPAGRYAFRDTVVADLNGTIVITLSKAE
ncbi:MAG: hypothetical protein K6G53_02525 [Bacteroidales bacterium]|nr:hypothetical protein [Bacteroidales bacterium]